MPLWAGGAQPIRFTPVLRSLTALPSAPRAHIWVQYAATPQAQVPFYSFRVAEGQAGGLEFTLLCERHFHVQMEVLEVIAPPVLLKMNIKNVHKRGQ